VIDSSWAAEVIETAQSPQIRRFFSAWVYVTQGNVGHPMKKAPENRGCFL